MIDNRTEMNNNKTITKIVTFYSDGTFTEFSPSPYMPNPYTVPYQPLGPYVGPYPPPYGPAWYTSVTGGGASVKTPAPKEPGPYGGGEGRTTDLTNAKFTY